MKALEIDDKTLPVRSVQFYISRAKDSIEAPADFKNKAGEDSKLVSVAAIYEMYQKRLKAANAMDFDDIILNTVNSLSNILKFLKNIRNSSGILWLTNIKIQTSFNMSL